MFFDDVPVRVDQVKALRGTGVIGPVMTVTTSMLAVDSSVDTYDAKLLKLGAIGIANVTLVRGMERIGEIGLRRALVPVDVAAQFLTESTILGLIASTVGASLGVLLTVAISALKQWTTVMDQRLVVVAARLLGAGT